MCPPDIRGKFSPEQRKAMAAKGNFDEASFWSEPDRGLAAIKDAQKKMKDSAAPPDVLPDATDAAITEADKLRRRELTTARRSLTNSFTTGPGRRSLLGGGL